MDLVYSTETEMDKEFNVPWFPHKLSDLDRYAQKTMEFSSDLSVDHPGFRDEQYRKRRTEVVEKAKVYLYGQPLPDIDYSDLENQTWKEVFTKLEELYPTHACSQFRRCFQDLKDEGIYSSSHIPQLSDVSRFVKEKTGFQLRPVQGLLTPREFLNGLAFRVFHATQYIRHHSKPMYTPEPDVCHELIGHVPLFADPQFADFSQEIGLASLGASDHDILALSTCYWFSVEFGVCQEVSLSPPTSSDSFDRKNLRAYGAGLLSSFGELAYCLSDTPTLARFDPPVTCKQNYTTTNMQPHYFVADSFEEASKQMREYALTLQRPFVASYDHKTEKLTLTKVEGKEGGASE
eukprot:CAMPEP_0201480946 /NCGR_PEP_ID=MMETSP0151_2-20130828/5306_1 /ASSEMBLY_ACC=CAM_ASM_000257 /TAXON_ID=200890 /ORGANISM="Paramoeba atlantica, Strain 621/1 / CCAP 1560/9" /LENGTH=347 /DNA_ID=CAMNT_0047862945 /DNA_START=27 /DNA_END=1067 /DNA_ORIENTATION=+